MHKWMLPSMCKPIDSPNKRRFDARRQKIARNLQEEEEIIEEAYSDMQAKRSVLMGELRLWEEKYLLIAPMSGKLDYLGFWHNNSMVAAGTEILSILLPQNPSCRRGSHSLIRCRQGENWARGECKVARFPLR